MSSTKNSTVSSLNKKNLNKEILFGSSDNGNPIIYLPLDDSTPTVSSDCCDLIAGSRKTMIEKIKERGPLLNIGLDKEGKTYKYFLNKVSTQNNGPDASLLLTDGINDSYEIDFAKNDMYEKVFQSIVKMIDGIILEEGNRNILGENIIESLYKLIESFPDDSKFNNEIMTGLANLQKDLFDNNPINEDIKSMILDYAKIRLLTFAFMSLLNYKYTNLYSIENKNNDYLYPIAYMYLQFHVINLLNQQRIIEMYKEQKNASNKILSYLDHKIIIPLLRKHYDEIQQTFMPTYFVPTEIKKPKSDKSKVKTQKQKKITNDKKITNNDNDKNNFLASKSKILNNMGGKNNDNFVLVLPLKNNDNFGFSDDDDHSSHDGDDHSTQVNVVSINDDSKNLKKDELDKDEVFGRMMNFCYNFYYGKFNRFDKFLDHYRNTIAKIFQIYYDQFTISDITHALIHSLDSNKDLHLTKEERDILLNTLKRFTDTLLTLTKDSNINDPMIILNDNFLPSAIIEKEEYDDIIKNRLLPDDYNKEYMNMVPYLTYPGTTFSQNMNCKIVYKIKNKSYIFYPTISINLINAISRSQDPSLFIREIKAQISASMSLGQNQMDSIQLISNTGTILENLMKIVERSQYEASLLYVARNDKFSNVRQYIKKQKFTYNDIIDYTNIEIKDQLLFQERSKYSLGISTKSGSLTQNIKNLYVHEKNIHPKQNNHQLFLQENKDKKGKDKEVNLSPQETASFSKKTALPETTKKIEPVAPVEAPKEKPLPILPQNIENKTNHTALTALFNEFKIDNDNEDPKFQGDILNKLLQKISINDLRSQYNDICNLDFHDLSNIHNNLINNLHCLFITLYAKTEKQYNFAIREIEKLNEIDIAKLIILAFALIEYRREKGISSPNVYFTSLEEQNIDKIRSSVKQCLKNKSIENLLNQKIVEIEKKSVVDNKQIQNNGEKNIGSDEKQIGSDEKQIGSDEKQIGSDEKKIDLDEKQIDLDEKILYSGKHLSEAAKMINNFCYSFEKYCDNDNCFGTNFDDSFEMKYKSCTIEELLPYAMRPDNILSKFESYYIINRITKDMNEFKDYNYVFMITPSLENEQSKSINPQSIINFNKYFKSLKEGIKISNDNDAKYKFIGQKSLYDLLLSLEKVLLDNNNASAQDIGKINNFINRQNSIEALEKIRKHINESGSNEKRTKFLKNFYEYVYSSEVAKYESILDSVNKSKGENKALLTQLTVSITKKLDDLKPLALTHSHDHNPQKSLVHIKQSASIGGGNK